MESAKGRKFLTAIDDVSGVAQDRVDSRANVGAALTEHGFEHPYGFRQHDDVDVQLVALGGLGNKVK